MKPKKVDMQYRDSQDLPRLKSALYIFVVYIVLSFSVSGQAMSCHDVFQSRPIQPLDPFEVDAFRYKPLRSLMRVLRAHVNQDDGPEWQVQVGLRVLSLRRTVKPALTTEALAFEILGMEEAQVQAIEAGESSLPVDKAILLSDYFNTPLYYIYAIDWLKPRAPSAIKFLKKSHWESVGQKQGLQLLSEK